MERSLAEPPSYLLGHRFAGEPEMLLDVLVRRRSAELVPSDDETFRSYHAAPGIGASDFDDHALYAGGRTDSWYEGFSRSNASQQGAETTRTF